MRRISLVVEKNPRIIIKIGGSTLGQLDTTLEDIAILQRRGTEIIVVHGGGATISKWMEYCGIAPHFLRGLRVTDEASLEIVISVLSGLVNKKLVAAMTTLGGKTIGLSGVDGAMLRARVIDSELGYVGEITEVNTEPVTQILEAGYIPFIAPVGIDDSSDSPNILNINGDIAAGYLASQLGAERLIFLTDVDGVLDASSRIIRQLTTQDACDLIDSGVASAGMIPKLQASIKALDSVREVNIIDGRVQKALLGIIDGDNAGTKIQRG